MESYFERISLEQIVSMARKGAKPKYGVLPLRADDVYPTLVGRHPEYDNGCPRYDAWEIGLEAGQSYRIKSDWESKLNQLADGKGTK